MGGTFTGEISIEISDIEPDINIIAAYIEQEDGSYEQVSDIPLTQRKVHVVMGQLQQE